VDASVTAVLSHAGDVLRAFGATRVFESSSGEMSATIDGTHLLVRIAPAGLPETLCSASLPEGLPRFVLELRPQTSAELDAVREGRAIDVLVGDEAFDDAFVIEAAPAELARMLLDAPTRDALIAIGPTRVVIDGTALRVDIRRLVTDRDALERVVATTLRMARRLSALPGELAEKRLTELQGAGLAAYRGPSPTVLRTIEEISRGDDEVAVLAAIRKERLRRRWMIAGVSAAAVVLAALAAAIGQR
jgi:hypothetical protein